MGGNSDLNGAYYGPAIPPPRKAYHPPSRGGGGCCCNPFSCCCSCLMNCICTCICQILCTILVIAAIVLVVLWFIFRPNIVKFYASDVTLTKFDLTDNTLRYNLTVSLMIRNPNRRIGIYYDQIEARALYRGQRFASVELTPFYQGHKNTSDLTAEFKGQNVVMLGSKELSDYRGDKDSGLFAIDLKLFLRTRFKFLFVKFIKLKPKIGCDLKVPLTSNGTAAGKYEFTTCHFAWR